MLSSCEMTNCLYHRRKWLSFVFIMFISNRFPSGFACTQRAEEKHDVSGTANYLVESFFFLFSFFSIFSAGGHSKRCFVVLLLIYCKPHSQYTERSRKKKHGSQREGVQTKHTIPLLDVLVASFIFSCSGCITQTFLQVGQKWPPCMFYKNLQEALIHAFTVTHRQFNIDTDDHIYYFRIKFSLKALWHPVHTFITMM